MCGCDPRNYFYTEDSLKKVAKKSLEEKYGEEFVIHRVWNKSQTMFFADCSPEDNEEVVFRADIRKNGDGIVSDGYAVGVVANEINDVLKDDFKRLFGDCCTNTYVHSYYKVPIFKNAKEATIDEYISLVDLDILSYYVYVDGLKLSNETIEIENEYLCKEIPRMIKNKIIPNLTIHIYFTTDELVKQYDDYLINHRNTEFEMNKNLDKYPNIHIDYRNGLVDSMYEGDIVNEKHAEYKEFRKDINNIILEEDQISE